MKRNRYDMWYIYRAPCAGGKDDLRWCLQFPLEVAERWWRPRPGLYINTFNTWEEARSYMVRVQREIHTRPIRWNGGYYPV